ncbi:MAG: hypothetical protein COB22_04350 [Cycloclasticus sp.]|nr:MAG: hypothetical protein COB22_04350 [Cycloclasticus sp.]
MPQQKTIPITINVTAFSVSSIKLNVTDNWLTSVFTIKYDSYFDDDSTLSKNSDGLVYELAYRIQLLSNEILRLTNIPAFFASHEIELIKGKDDEKTWNVVIPFPFIENVSIKAYEITVNAAFELLYWMGSNKLSTSNIETLYKLVEQKINAPLAPYFSGWKSTLPILKAAYNKNIPFINFGRGLYQLGWGSKSHLMSDSANEYDSAIGGQAAQDKTKAVSILKMACLPTTTQMSVSSVELAISAANKIGWPVVIKPSARDRGEGVTINVNSTEMLQSAYDKARELSPHRPILIEKMLKGTCHRIFISNYQFLYCARRWPRSVKGDGQHTVAQLISDKNAEENSKAPWLRSKNYPSDSFAKKIMKENGYTLKSIPNAGELVPLRPFQSDEWGGSADDVTADVHPENVDLAIRTARLFNLYNCGVDIMSTDISKPWHTNGAAIMEVNYTPSLGDSPVSIHYVNPYLERLINGDGRIPIHFYMGGTSALESAKQKQATSIESGINSYLTSHKLTLNASNKETTMPNDELMKRCFALLLDRQVQELIVVVQTDECLFEGVPFDQINSMVVVDELLTSWKDSNVAIPAHAAANARQLLEKLVVNQKSN